MKAWKWAENFFSQLNPNIREVCQSNKLATLNIFSERKAQIMDIVVDKNLFLCFSSQFSGNNTMAAEKKLGQCVNVHLIKLSINFATACQQNSQMLVACVGFPIFRFQMNKISCKEFKDVLLWKQWFFLEFHYERLWEMSAS